MIHHDTPNRLGRALVAFTVVASVMTFAIGSSGEATAAPMNCDRGINLSFEDPAISGSWTFVTAPGWDATDAVEVWRNPFGPGAVDGEQLTELKANDGSPLWQDIPTFGGDRVAWSFSHRGRAATDTVDVLLGSTVSQTLEGTFSDGTSAWGRHGGVYTVPASQTTTRFVLDPHGGGSVGNLVDLVLFELTCEISITTSVGTTTDPDSSGDVSEGDTITFLYDLENLGTATLASVGVTEALGDAVTCPASVLEPGETMQCSASHLVTQTDVDAGSVDASGEGSGTDAGGVTVTDTSAVSVDVPQDPAITIVTSATVDDTVAAPPTRTDVGDTVDHEYLVTNTGNVTLTDITVTDPGVGTVSCPTTTLAPGDNVTCTASFVVTQPALDAGVVPSAADVVGTPPMGDDVVDDYPLDTPLDQNPALDVVKATPDTSYDTVGQTLTYTIDVTNTGSVTVDEIDVTDPNADADSIVCDLALPATLGPGETLACTAEHTVTQADIDAGSVENTAAANGTDPGDAPVSDTSETIAVDADQQPSVDLTKIGTVDNTVAGPAGRVDAGDVITYSLDVVNSGNVTITDFTVSDPLLGTVTCDPAPIAPGDMVTCGGSYEITQADIDAGVVTNDADVDAVTSGGPAADDATWAQALVQSPDLTIDKTSDTTTVGDGTFLFSYTISLANEGNTTITGLQVTDDLDAVLRPGTYTVDKVTGINVTANAGFDGSSDTDLLAGTDSIAPGEGAAIVLTLTVTPDGPGPYRNEATAVAANGADPIRTAATDEVTVDVSHDLSITKSGISAVAEGDDHEWTLTVTNDGPSVASGPITITDVLDERLTFVSASGAGWSCTEASGTVTCVHEGDLVADGTSTVTVVTRVDAPVGTAITNVASVTSVHDDNDNDPTNNTSGTSVVVDALPVTGIDTTTVAMIGLAQLLLGLALLLAARRRRNPTAATTSVA